MESSKVARVVFGFILLCGIGESFLDDSVVVVDLNYDPLMRQLGGGQLPGSLTFRLERPGQENVHLNLVENRRLNQDAPMFEVKRQQDGTDKLVQRQCRKIEDAKFYQDKTNKASLMVSCVGRGYGPCKRQLTGSIELDDVAYEIMPAPEMASHERSFAVANRSPHIMMRVKDMASGGSGEPSEEETTDNKEKIPPRPHPNGGRRGAQDSRDFTDAFDSGSEELGDKVPPKPNPFALNKGDQDVRAKHIKSFDDAKVPPELERKEIDVPFDDAKIQPEEVGKGIDGHSDVRMKLLTELKEVLMRKYPQPPRSRLHSNRQKRQSRVYALEVLVGIDPSVWAWYYERTNAADGMTKEEMTEHEIRKQFSHIINGISQRYENIEDPEMNIYVTVSGFLIYKTRDSTNPLPLSTPIQTVEDSQLVDGEVYLDSLAPWLAGLSGLPHNDHAMVFTRYDLQADGSTGVVGIAWLSNVCKFYRVSINEESSYFITTSVGAHELGHNLGSGHDGGGSSSACNPNDQFIMAPSVTVFSRKDEYTMNPWKFSDCSVNAFKSYVSLLDTENNNCLLDHGDYYNEDEYQSHVSQLPGQLYTVEEQCKRTRGDNSTQSCGQTSTDPVICRALLCSGGDDFCYYQAALPGTPCDAPATNKWCRYGECVEKTTETTNTTMRATTNTTTSTTRTTTTTTRSPTTTTSTTPTTTTTSTTRSPTTTTSTTQTTTKSPTTTTSTTQTATARSPTTTSRTTTASTADSPSFSCEALSQHLYDTYGDLPQNWCNQEFWDETCGAYCATHGGCTTDVGWQNWSCKRLSRYFLRKYDLTDADWCQADYWRGLCCVTCSSVR